MNNEKSSFAFPSPSFRENVFMGVLFGLVELVGISANLLVIIAVARERRLQTKYYFLVTLLAVCDLSMLLCSLLDNILPRWTAMASSVVICTIWDPLQNGLYIVRSHLLLLIGLLRYKAVCRPLSSMLSRREIKGHVLVILFFSILWIIPHALVRDVQDSTCSEKWVGSVGYSIYYVAITSYAFLIPLIILAVLYAKIWCGLVRHQRELNKMLIDTPSEIANRYLSATQARHIRAFVISMIVVVAFAASCLPSTIGWVLLAYTETIDYHQLQWTVLIYYAGVSVANPIIYGLRDRALLFGYKRCLKYILSGLKPRGSST